MSDVTETTVVTTEPAVRNPLVLVLAAVAAILAGALVWFFVISPLLLGDDAGNPAVTAPPPGPATTEPGEDPTDAPSAEELLEEAEIGLPSPTVTYEVFLARDPFDPVVPLLAVGAGDGGPGVDDVPGSPTSPTSPTAPGDPTSPGDPSSPGDPGSPGSPGSPGTPGNGGAPPPSGGCTEGENLVCDGRVVSLIEIRTGDDGEPVAVIQVDSTIYEVRVGETFAGSFRLQSIGRDRVVLLYGDDAFELREGDRVLK
ncbi:MAG: hypothetical protein WD186_07245 [Actinomycetota bacterium]